MKSPEEIKKAIWKCLPGNKELCDMCPYNDYGENGMHPCWETRIKDTLAYIQQLEREKEELVKNKLLSEGVSLDLREVVKVCEGELLVAALNMISDMQAAAPKWISVKERLPEDSERVLTVSVDGYMMTGYVVCVPGDRRRMTAYYCENGYDSLDNVTHWMKLPEPPEEED